MTAKSNSVADGIGSLYTSILSLLASCDHPAVSRMLRGQPNHPGKIVQQQPVSKPVLAFLSKVSRQVSPRTDGVMGEIVQVASDLRWNQTYDAGDVSQRFLKNYAWGVVGSPDGPVRMNAMQMVLLFLGPNTEYPSHRHEPEEAYYVIAGSGLIKIEDGEWEPLRPGSVIHNPPGQLHGILTNNDPIIMVSLFKAATVPKSVFSVRKSGSR